MSHYFASCFFESGCITTINPIASHSSTFCSLLSKMQEALQIRKVSGSKCKWNMLPLKIFVANRQGKAAFGVISFTTGNLYFYFGK